MTDWLKKNPQTFFLLLALVILAAFLRFYRLDEFMSFLGDEGRDALVVKKIVTAEHFPLLGPVTSTGNMYLGPFFYYLQVFPMWISNLNPISMAATVALTGVATVILLYIFASEAFNQKIGLFSAALYAVSPQVVEFVRSSWNPRPVPFFTLLLIYALFKMFKEKKVIWFLVAAFSLSAALQLHYLAIFLIPVVFISLIIIGKNMDFNPGFLRLTSYFLILFLLMMSPLLLFDLRHNFLNLRALIVFLQSDGATFNPVSSFLNFLVDWPNFFNQLLIPDSRLSIATSFLAVIFLAFFFRQKYQKQDKNKDFAGQLLILWLIIGFLGINFYKGPLYLHYYGFLFPVPFLLVSLILGNNWKNRILSWGSILVFLILFAVNLKNVYLFGPAGRQLYLTQDIAREIIKQSNGKPFNFALIAERNYDSAYQYFLELWKSKPLQTDSQVTDQLFVVCEDPICQPINHPKWEIASFGWALIDQEWEIKGVKLYKLVHNPAQKITAPKI